MNNRLFIACTIVCISTMSAYGAITFAPDDSDNLVVVSIQLSAPTTKMRKKHDALLSNKMPDDWIMDLMVMTACNEELSLADLYHFASVNKQYRKVALHEKFRISGQRELNDQFLRRIHKALRPDHSIVLWAAKKGYDPLFMQHERIMPLLNAPEIDPTAANFITALRTNEADGGGYTPVHYLAQRGHRGALDCIMTLDASLENCITPCDEKPLHIALQNGHMDVFLFFLYRMHNQPAWHAPTKYGDTLLHHVAFAGDLDFLQTVETFLKVAAHVDLITKDTINAVNQKGNAPLHHASQKGSWAFIKHLAIDKFFVAPPKNTAGRSPSDESLFYGNGEWIDNMRETQFYSDKTIADQSTRLQSYLWQAIKGNEPAMVEKVLKLGASCNKMVHNPTEEIDELPLHEAAYFGYSAVVSVLLKHGAHVNAKGFENLTALAWAVAENKPVVVRMLLNANANMNVLARITYKDDGIKIPLLSCAAFYGCIDVIELLINAGHSMHTPDDWHYNPLQWAIAGNQEIAVKRLITHGVLFDSPALECAQEHKRDKILAILKAEQRKRRAAADKIKPLPLQC